MLFSSALLSLFAASASARSVASPRWNLHEKRDVIPAEFVQSGVAPEDHVLNMRINLVMGDQAGLESALEAASNPTSPTFREWLSKDQVCVTVFPGLVLRSTSYAFLFISWHAMTGRILCETDPRIPRHRHILARHIRHHAKVRHTRR